MHIVEKHLRDEVINRCLEFLDIAIHFILYIEQIYSDDLFEKRLKYNHIAYECNDVDVQHYITDFLNQFKVLFRQQLVDQIGFVITKVDEHDVLRRYLIELHPIIDHSLNTIHSNGEYLLVELDSIFATCLRELMRQKPVSPIKLTRENHDDDEPIRWKLQMRLYQNGNSKFDFEDIFYEQLKLSDNYSLSLKPIKSAHCRRLNLQLMCQEKKFE